MKLTSIKSKEFGHNQELFDDLIKSLKEDFARYKDQKIKFVVGNVVTAERTASFIKTADNVQIGLNELVGTLFMHACNRAENNGLNGLLSALMSEE